MANDATSQQTSGAGAAVALERVVKRFGAVAAVDAVDLAIAPGEFITLLGPSGSGKTTTLMMIAGFDTPTSGEIYVDGKAIVAVPPYRRDIGMVFQSYALFPHMTVAENVGFALRQRGRPKAEIAAEVAAALDIVRLRGYETRYPRQLSGGQQQRVALARAIIFKPRVLLMDEPLSALDKQLREGLQLEIKRLHTQLGITFIYVTHDQREALVMSDRIAVMNEGRIAQVGTPTALYDRPANRFVASFVGESNFFDGAVVAVDGKRVAVSVGDATVTAVAALPAPAVGARVVLAVRPEKIVFSTEGARASDANVAEATVRDIAFVGEMYRYALDLFGAPVVVKQQHRAVQPRQPGERVTLEWHVDDTLVV